MNAILTGKPADICTRKMTDRRTRCVYFLPPADSHRNAPCPCGSGKKYKRCCLSKEGNK